MRAEKGQVLVGVVVLMLVLAIIVPVMVMYVNNESKWSTKQAQNTNAFQLAESAVDRAYQKITESTSTWVNLQNGTMLAGYNLDVEYTELPGGSYAIGLSSGPDAQTVRIYGIGRDKRRREVRALKVTYVNTPLGANAIQAGGVIYSSGTNQIEWGSAVSPRTINLAAGTNHPRFYSAAGIPAKDINGSLPPNTDSTQWWTYYPDIPPAPYIDFDFYRSSAIATGTCISETTTGIYAGCVNAGINSCNPTGWSGGGDHDCSTGSTSKACKGYTWFINCPTNGVTITSNDQTWLKGTMIVIGNLSMEASAASGTYDADVPPTAWKNYGNDWAYFKTNGNQFGIGGSCTGQDATPANFPGLNSTYTTPASFKCTLGNVLVRGFLYVSGNANFQSGGVVRVHGAAYVAGNVSVGSGGYVVFYDPVATQNLATTRLVLTRSAWEDVLRDWPAGL